VDIDLRSYRFIDILSDELITDLNGHLLTRRVTANHRSTKRHVSQNAHTIPQTSPASKRNMSWRARSLNLYLRFALHRIHPMPKRRGYKSAH
jgi:hypothetical protein